MSNEKPKSVFDQLGEGQVPVVEGAQKGQAKVTSALPEASAAIAGADANTLSQLLQYLILKEGREAQTAQLEQEREKARTIQRDRNAKDQDVKTIAKQARCRHLKGGKRGPKTQNKDHAVYRFQFIDFTEYIRCRICGMKWYNKDTKEHLVRVDRNGKERKISNHTHSGWREALDMVEASTDTMAASERIPNIAPNATNIGVFGDQFKGRYVDTETGEAIEGVVI